MSLLQRVLSPVARDFWIGRTFIHEPQHEAAGRPVTRSGGLDLTPLPADGADTEGSRRFAARLDGTVVGTCLFAFGEPYLRAGGFYSLADRQAELTDIFTAPECRGRGVATALIRYSTSRMHDEGFLRLFAKVWHSNVASARAFGSAGWLQASAFIRIYPRGTTRICHLDWPTGRA